MKTVLFLIDTPLKDPIRGTPIRIVNVLRELRKHHHVFVCATDVSAEFNDIFISYPKGSFFEKLRFLRSLIRERGIQVVMTATELGMRWPVILKWTTGVRIVMDVHGLQAEELLFAGSINRLRALWMRLQTSFFYSWYDLLFPCAGKLGSYYGWLKRRMRVIYGGVNLRELSVGAYVSPAIFTLGYMGNARAYQGLEDFFQAAVRLREEGAFPFRLNLIISNDREKVMARVKELNFESITDAHFDVPHDQVLGLIAQSSVLAIPRPSLVMTEYAYPSKMPEYLLTGVPVVVTDVGPIQELFASDNMCVIIPAQDIAAGLAKACKDIERLSEAERRAMGERAQAFVKRRLTWEILGREMSETIDHL